MTVKAPPGGALLPQHLAMLSDESGLPEDVINERGYYSATTYSEVRRLGFSDSQCITPALVIPLWSVHGERGGYQLRPDQPRQGANGKIVKYETPRGSRVMLDVPPRCRPMLRDPGIPLYITEGSKKADALAARGVCAVALSGVWNWRGTNELGGKMALPDWDSVPVNERLVRIVFDSDVSRKQAVAAALLKLKSFLERKDAVVEIAYLPDQPDGKKQGIDDFLSAGGTIADLEGYVSTTVKLPAFEEEPDALPAVMVTDRHLRELVQDCWQLLANVNERKAFTFQRAGQLVRVDSSDGTPVIRQWSEDDVHFVLERLARFEKLAKDGEGFVTKPARLPTDAARDILAAWSKPVPRLKGIVRTPVLASDGSLSIEPGYQPTSQLFFDERGAPIPEVPERTQPADLRRALKLIDDWLGDFPFLGEASRANTIGMVLTYVTRELITGPTPLFVVTAPTQGTGKGLLVQTSGIVLLGTVPAVTTEPRDADEWRKRITAQLLEGAGMILLDNVKRRLAAAELAAALTSEEWSDRLLGTNQTTKVPNRALWVVTGNNIELDGEIARRSILIGLDAKRDRPWEGRTFRHADLIEWVTERRADLVWALLVLARHWLALGRPPFSGKPIGSYESWTRVIGGILESAGIRDFLSNREDLYLRADQETEEWRAFVSAWAAKHATDSVKAGELAELVLELDLLDRMRASITEEDVTKALKIRLGKALSRYADRRFGDWFIRRRGIDSHQKGKLYALELAEDAAPESGPSANPPHDFGPFPDSDAEDAESAEDVFSPYARELWEDETHDPSRTQYSFRGGNNSPHPPHSPPPDSESDEFQAEDWDWTEGQTFRNNSNPPRCEGCGREMSVVAVSSRCGYCLRADRD